MATKQSLHEIEQLIAEWSPTQLMDQIPGYLYIKDLEGTLVSCSRSLREDFRENPVNKTEHEIMPKEEADQIRENDKKVMASQRTQVFIERGPTKKGKEPGLFLSVKAPLFNDNGHVIGIIGHSTRITAMGPLSK